MSQDGRTILMPVEHAQHLGDAFTTIDKLIAEQPPKITPELINRVMTLPFDDPAMKEWLERPPPECVSVGQVLYGAEPVIAEQPVERPVHHITQEGCSICGTDALNCRFFINEQQAEPPVAGEGEEPPLAFTEARNEMLAGWNEADEPPKPLGKYSGAHPSIPGRRIVGYLYQDSWPSLHELPSDPLRPADPLAFLDKPETVEAVGDALSAVEWREEGFILALTKAAIDAIKRISQGGEGA